MVPVFGFGQNDVFDKQPKIDYLLRYKPGRSKWEKWSKVFLKGVMQVMFARFGVMPYPHPITVVGKFQMILKTLERCTTCTKACPMRSDSGDDKKKEKRRKEGKMARGCTPLSANGTIITWSFSRHFFALVCRFQREEVTFGVREKRE